MHGLGPGGLGFVSGYPLKIPIPFIFGDAISESTPPGPQNQQFTLSWVIGGGWTPQPNWKICACKVKLDHGLPGGEHIEKFAGFNHCVFHPQKTAASPSRQSIRFQLEGVLCFESACVFFQGLPRFAVPNINQKTGDQLMWILYSMLN